MVQFFQSRHVVLKIGGSSFSGLLIRVFFFWAFFYIKPVFDCMLNHFYKNKNWLYIFPVRNDDKII